MDNKNYWNIFEKSGNIDVYMLYKQSDNTSNKNKNKNENF